MMSGSALSQCTLFALGVSPYINSSIIIQLLTVAIPALERLSKEGEEGRRKLTRITKYASGGIALGMSIGYYFVLRNLVRSERHRLAGLVRGRGHHPVLYGWRAAGHLPGRAGGQQGHRQRCFPADLHRHHRQLEQRGHRCQQHPDQGLLPSLCTTWPSRA